MLFQIYLFLVDVCVFLYGIFQILRKTTFEYYIIRYQLSTFTIMTLTNNQDGIRNLSSRILMIVMIQVSFTDIYIVLLIVQRYMICLIFVRSMTYQPFHVQFYVL